MTRKKAYERAQEANHTDDIYRIIDDIYDDFESRTCENCKYWKQENKAQKEGSTGMCKQYVDTDKYFSIGIVGKNYGCNRFKMK